MMHRSAILLVLVVLSGCASIVVGDTQILSVETPLCPKALCKLVNEQGTYFVAETPGTVTINKSYSPMVVECSKGDFKETISLESSTVGMTFGNILLGGIIGTAIDMGTGAAYEYDTLIQHPIDCKE